MVVVITSNGKRKSISDKLHRKLIQSPLAYVAAIGDMELTLLMIRKGADVNHQIKNGNTALHVAVFTKNFGLVKMLLKNGANVDAVNDEGNSALHMLFGIRKSCPKIARLLLSKDAKVDIPNFQDLSPVHLAASKQDVAILKLLNEKFYADLRIPSPSGKTCLHYAATNRHTEVVDYLVSEGVDLQAIDDIGDSALHTAARYHNNEAILKLLHYGVDCNLVNGDGDTALHIVLRSERHSGIAWSFFEHGFDVSGRDRNAEPILWTAEKLNSDWAIDIIAEIARIECTGGVISDENNAVFDSNPKYANFLEICRQQLKMMNCFVFYDKVPYFALLRDSLERLLMYVLDEDFIRVFEDSSCWITFPIYQRWMKQRFEHVVSAQRTIIASLNESNEL